ncbi:MAG: hypothetical protein A2268_03605 [Candidatus Raymondbacteria bacterium RifOxyA12_full_50_37]|uniref:BFN domain-containing protein n=1 Tax=Candidatus Raymondbacteria bacterium RIFOXYD12_FULL_49_13 TaxID=1817890 RepID=A0A1F7F4V9_UNCRA|nr:MAG: hypothetical protein A2268_03605 [Candidatus Raymondbacteria bacterium RifOxyA12_full_50_37]OGJ91880.1 MAG: hypothetical protein A2248_04675 [Candidatus Raymondbacteria bacterium RIFOXYA2_FULL_49_16]OGJ98082.1 MAG: hypothetical protein A2453_12340 [Candidatus Raymondbacteria bacterium RIFOXYC2_FULL_50_21]OGJ98094.1 MAG: hypothetical protein A2487_03895 [Candidatus Raymondbacteria bacterium RifOxyC12_full_50_8]OGK01671.1 MAG: hypothetical protein A2519_09070 [Candidatus Raymondbacteria b
MIHVSVSALAIDAGTNSPIVLLKEERGERVLPIWIGFPEASAIAMARSYEKKEIERPLTHDLLKLILDALEAKLIKVAIDELDGTTYKAKLYLQSGNSSCYIDVRPSDAIALALRTNAPIFIKETILGSAEQEADGANNIANLRKRLREIDPSDFGKFSF